MKLVWTILATIFLSANVLNAQLDLVAPSTPLGVQAFGYEKNVDIEWYNNSETDLAGYKIYKWNGTQYYFLHNCIKRKKLSCISMLVRWELVIHLKLVHMI